ncbi:XRE family transcriptional regulator [Clavibacter lycopersici]|uniref:XRE family transcriptional regulator n=1 Tax=Clavibacter lycopersici TaxID=2301718 RepID=A0A399T7A5_9MICO|nr:helix-turn-helix transcriptional regulator [Clavibacter lycopersici]RIJ52166.1 XRE family transcriptional regulator [Clavibacter lycopersici]RIJ61271.1 XRE family transcriptional regulator [Clavibacter lycopersici]
MNGTRVAELRREQGWTQDRLAEASGITVRSVQRLEAGDDASLETLSLVARAFDVPVRELFTSAPSDEYGETVVALDARAEEQQERRDAVTDGVRSLYAGVGVLLTLAVVFSIAADVLPNLAIVVVPAYRAGGFMLANAAFLFLLSPRLDRAYPLSRDRGGRRARTSRGRIR